MLRSLAMRIAEFGWHIELLVNVDEAPDFAKAVTDFPVPIVLGHLGYPEAGARQLDGESRVRRSAAADRRRALLDQADRPLSHLGRG